MIALFDFDGVIVDTESQYTVFWDRVGLQHLGIENFGHLIKGQTLKQISGRHFKGREDALAEILPQLEDFERNMSYDYVPGAEEFIRGLKAAGVPMAIVTSSNKDKMSNAFKAHPELPEIMDAVLMSEDFSASKPDPECYLKGMQVLGGVPERSIVFEDSFHGIQAGRSAGAFVVGLTTTNPRSALLPLCDLVVDDFRHLKFSDIFSHTSRCR